MVSASTSTINKAEKTRRQIRVEPNIASEPFKSSTSSMPHPFSTAPMLYRRRPRISIACPFSEELPGGAVKPGNPSLPTINLAEVAEVMECRNLRQHQSNCPLGINPDSVQGRWPAHQPRSATRSLEKPCPVHRGLIAMSGRVAAQLVEQRQTTQ